MAERLYVEKSPLQRRIEGLLHVAVPPLVAGLLWHGQGPSFPNTLLVLAAFFLVAPLGNLIASLMGGERITADERMRRILERLAKVRFVFLVGWIWLTYAVLFASALFAATGPAVLAAQPLTLATIALATLFGALLVSYQLRCWRVRYLRTRPAERYQSVGQWVKAFVPIQIVCVGIGLTAGFVAAHYVPPDYGFLALAAGWLAGVGIETVAAERLLQRKPLLWSQLGFGSALVVAMARMGLMFAMFFAFYAQLDQFRGAGLPDGVRFAAFLSAAFALMGFVFGTLLMLAVWAIARLGDLGSKKTPGDKD